MSAGVYYSDVDIKCPFYIRGASGFIQCEGFEECSTVKLLFCSSEDGHPLREDRLSYSERYCNQSYETCPIYQLAMMKYGESK